MLMHCTVHGPFSASGSVLQLWPQVLATARAWLFFTNSQSVSFSHTPSPDVSHSTGGKHETDPPVPEPPVPEPPVSEPPVSEPPVPEPPVAVPPVAVPPVPPPSPLSSSPQATTL